jgi:hypothetical protein
MGKKGGSVSSDAKKRAAIEREIKKRLSRSVVNEGEG